jgi:DNA-binding MarR family transcriptional regulator
MWSCMTKRRESLEQFREFRNTAVYRSVNRILRVSNRHLLERLHERGFTDFSPAYPALLSNLDTEGTRVGVLAARAGTTRQAAGQLLADIERAGYVSLGADPDDARATLVTFTARGRSMLANVLEIVDEFEHGFEPALGPGGISELRRVLFAVAEAIDPEGALGQGDRSAAKGTARASVTRAGNATERKR